MLLLWLHNPTMCSVLKQWSPALCSSCCWSGFCLYLVSRHRCEPTCYTWFGDSNRFCTLSWFSFFRIAYFQIYYYRQHIFCSRLSIICRCELWLFGRSLCRSATLYWSLLLPASAASQFRVFSPLVCYLLAFDGSSPTITKNCTSHSIYSLLCCTYLSGNVLSYLWAHWLLWCSQVWGMTWCYARWNSSPMLH